MRNVCLKLKIYFAVFLYCYLASRTTAASHQIRLFHQNILPTPKITETPLLLKIIKIAMSVPRYLQPLVIFDPRVSTRSNKTTHFREKEQLFLG